MVVYLAASCCLFLRWLPGVADGENEEFSHRFAQSDTDKADFSHSFCLAFPVSIYYPLNHFLELSAK